MPALVEEVARAICEAEKMNPDDALGGWLHWKEAAEAAIRAVKSGALTCMQCGAILPFEKATPK
jgi:hypothetical protein